MFANTGKRPMQMLAIALAVNATILLADDSRIRKPGTKVIVTKLAPLKVESEVLARIPEKTILTVDKVHDNWLWVEHKNQAGWLDEQYVVSIQAHVATLNKRGDEAFKNKEWDEAQRIFSQVLEFDAQDRHAMLYHADTLFWQQDYEAAIAGFDKLLNIHKEDHVALFWRGDAWFELNEYEKAIADYSRSIELSPGSIGAYRMRGRALGKIDQPNNAVVDFTIALHLATSDGWKASLHQDRGDVWQAMGHEAAAAADFALAARLQSDDSSALWIKAARILVSSSNHQIRDPNRAIQYALRACSAQSDPPAEWLELLVTAFTLAEKPEFATQVKRKLATMTNQRRESESEVQDREFEFSQFDAPAPN